MCARKKNIYTYTYVFKEPPCLQMFFWVERSSLSSWKSVLLTEFSDSTLFFLNWVLNSLYFTEQIKPLPDGQPRLLQALITSHTHLSLQIRKYDWRVAFPHALFPTSIASEQMMPRRYLQLFPKHSAAVPGGALLSYLRKGKWMF